MATFYFTWGKRPGDMLNKRYRISKSPEYENTYNKGFKIPGRYIVAYILPNGLPCNRFGIVASRKIGNAVVRNKAKRRLRAIAENSRIRINPGYNIVLIARQGIINSDHKRLERDFYTVMKKAGLC